MKCRFDSIFKAPYSFLSIGSIASNLLVILMLTDTGNIKLTYTFWSFESFLLLQVKLIYTVCTRIDEIRRLYTVISLKYQTLSLKDIILEQLKIPLFFFSVSRLSSYGQQMPFSWKESFQFFWYSSIHTNKVSPALCWKRFFFTRKILTKLFFFSSILFHPLCKWVWRVLVSSLLHIWNFRMSPYITREYRQFLLWSLVYIHCHYLNLKIHF